MEMSPLKSVVVAFEMQTVTRRKFVTDNSELEE
jgi:hypothetical protein